MEEYKEISLNKTSFLRKGAKKTYEVITNKYFSDKIIYLGFFVYRIYFSIFSPLT